EYDRRLGVAGTQLVAGADRDCGDDCRSAEKMLDQRRHLPGLTRILRREYVEGPCRQGGQTAAQQVEAGRDFETHVGRCRIGRGARMDVFDLVRAVDDRHDVVLEIGLQPIADVVDPLRVIVVADSGRAVRRAGNAVELAQDADAIIGDGLPDQLLLAAERDLVGALRRGQNRNDHADDSYGNDDADWQNEAKAGAVPPRPARAVAPPGNALLQSRLHPSILFIAGRFEGREKTLQIACKLAACLLAMGTGGSAPRPMSLNSAAGLISGKGRQPPGAYRRSRAPAAGRPRNADMGRAQSRRPALPQIDEIRLAGLDPVDQPIPLRKECAEWRRMDEALLRFGIAVDRKGNADAAEQEFCFAPTEVEHVGLDLCPSQSES